MSGGAKQNEPRVKPGDDPDAPTSAWVSALMCSRKCALGLEARDVAAACSVPESFNNPGLQTVSLACNNGHLANKQQVM